MSCSFAKQVWQEVEGITGLRNGWSGDLIEEGLINWCGNDARKNYRALPLIVARGIWLARNAKIFEERDTLHLQYATQGLNIISSFIQRKAIKVPTQIVAEYIDKISPRAFFDGASQGDPPTGGAGGVLHLSDSLGWDMASITSWNSWL